MAVLNVLVCRSPEQIWNVLSDGWAYREWVMGTQAIKAVDDGWPAAGTSIRYAVGVGPLSMTDRTTVRISEPCRELQLEAHAGWIGTARIAIQILPWGEHSVVIFDEHPLSGRGARLHNMAIDGLLRLRNRWMLDKLAELVERRHPE